MDIRQLNALVAVVDYGTFSAAARALHTVQSNISTHIAHLERDLGVVLVDRATGTLTDEGNVVVTRARRVQAELEAIRLDVTALRDQVSGLVRIGVIGTTGRWLLPRLLEIVADLHPGIRVQVVDATTTSLVPLVVAGSLDGAIINLPIEHSDLDAEVLFKEEPVLVAPLDHPLSGYDVVEPQHLATHPLLLNPPGVAFRDQLDSDLVPYGVELTAKAEIDGMRLLASLAADGFGAAILPATATLSAGPWKRVAVKGLTSRLVGLISNRRVPLSAPTRAVRDVLRDVIRNYAYDQVGIHPQASK